MFRPLAFAGCALIAVALCGQDRTLAGDGITHLVPVNPYPGKRSLEYREAWVDLLYVDEIEHDDGGLFLNHDVVVVAIRPAFDPERLVAFRSGKLIGVSVDQNIWFALQAGEDEPDGGKARLARIKVVRTSTDLGIERCDRIRKVVEKVLRGTRYPVAKADAWEDSTRYEFRSRSEQLYGEATDGPAGPAKLLVDLSEISIKLLAASDAGGRETLIRQLDQVCSELEAAIGK